MTNIDWILDFDDLCVPKQNIIDILSDSNRLSAILSLTTKLKDEHMSKIITKPPLDFHKLFTNISPYSTDFPCGLKDEDLFLYYTDYLLDPKNDVWNTFLTSADGIPERIIIGCVGRLDLIYDKPYEVSQVLRYCILYSIFNIHYENVLFIRQYITVLANSILEEMKKKETSIYMETFVTSVWTHCDDLLEEHIKTVDKNSAKLNYKNILNEIKDIYTIIGGLERLILHMYSSPDGMMCDYHAREVLWKVDQKSYLKLPDLTYGNCKCDKMFVIPYHIAGYIEQLKRITEHIMNDETDIRFDFSFELKDI